MNRRVLVLAVAAVLSLNACTLGGEYQCACPASTVTVLNEANVSLLNERFLSDFREERRIMHNNCPLLPADSLLYPAPECIVLAPDVKACREGPFPIFPTDPEQDPEKSFELYKAREELYKDRKEELSKAREEELQRVRSDSTRTAILTISKNRTLIKVAPFFYDAGDVIELKDSKKADTLYIELIPKGFDEVVSINANYFKSDCPLSFDIVLNHVDENIAVIVFENDFGAQVFQAKYQ